jgi:hypothetical protein
LGETSWQSRPTDNHMSKMFLASRLCLAKTQMMTYCALWCIWPLLRYTRRTRAQTFKLENVYSSPKMWLNGSPWVCHIDETLKGTPFSKTVSIVVYGLLSAHSRLCANPERQITRKRSSPVDKFIHY